MSKKTIEKTWVPGNLRGTTTFNAPGNLTIPYGRYKATLDGRGGTGGANTAATWNTNYNVAYPIANQPIDTQPAATWNTNYNVVYPIANQPAATWNTNYNTNYNIAYPIANQPAATWNTNYNTVYPIANRPIATQPAATWNTNYNVVYPVGNQPATAHAYVFAGQAHHIDNWAQTKWSTTDFLHYYEKGGTGPANCDHQGGTWGPIGVDSPIIYHYDVHHQWHCQFYSGSTQATAWTTNYNVAYPIANRPVATWNTNYNTNYNVAYPIANRPAATWNTNYNTVYPIANRPIANQPAATWNTNYNTVYPIANRPAATWNTNYNTNYNTVYPIANQPIATYSVGPAGTPITIFGVTMPGAPGGGSTATPISPTPISYYTKPDGSSGEPDNVTYPVTVPTGGQIVFKIE